MKQNNLKTENNLIISLVLAILSWTTGSYIGLIFGIIALIFYLKIKNKSVIEAKIIILVIIFSLIINIFDIIIFYYQINLAKDILLQLNSTNSTLV